VFGLRGFRVVASVVSAATIVSAAPAIAQTTTPTAPLGPPPKAFIVVDQATGAVISGSNEHTPLPPASLTKILTALVAVAALKPTDTVPISERAAAMPAHKLNMKAGEVWPVDEVLSALLASSANDAAAAVAERVSGSLENFDTALDALSQHLQMADAPTLQDAAGLDDSSSVRGGNRISARDLAIAARAVLAEPRLAPIVARPITEFVGPDGIHHRLVNHNKMLTRYAGAIGMKTGYTRRAGRGLIAAATRNGRTEIAVVLNVADTYGWAAQLLDAGFAQPVPRAADHLPALHAGLRLAPATASLTNRAPARGATVSATLPARDGTPIALRLLFVLLALVVVLCCMLRARVIVRRRYRRHRRAHAQVRRQVHRRRNPHLTPHYKPHEELADRFHEVSSRR
jgi:D-alanyl-D-alanine carboxypeptidase (penicillin-binding protein 5/6)